MAQRRQRPRNFKCHKLHLDTLKDQNAFYSGFGKRGRPDHRRSLPRPSIFRLNAGCSALLLNSSHGHCRGEHF